MTRFACGPSKVPAPPPSAGRANEFLSAFTRLYKKAATCKNTRKLYARVHKFVALAARNREARIYIFRAAKREIKYT
jgi:hypothetical protein